MPNLNEAAVVELRLFVRRQAMYFEGSERGELADKDILPSITVRRVWLKVGSEFQRSLSGEDHQMSLGELSDKVVASFSSDS